LLVNFQDHCGDQLNDITTGRDICRGQLMRRADRHRWSRDAEADFDPALHAVTLQDDTSRTAPASVEHAPPQLLVKSHQIDMRPLVGTGNYQRGFFS
jgi:hypothetical protein